MELNATDTVREKILAALDGGERTPSQIALALGYSPEVVLEFLQKELAWYGNVVRRGVVWRVREGWRKNFPGL